MEKQISVTQERLRSAYQNATKSQKELLENLFGKDSVDIRDKIKTYEDACDYLNVAPAIFDEKMPKDEVAYKKLKTICKALNERKGMKYLSGNWFIDEDTYKHNCI